MRRILSILLFVLGGWMLASELFAAFIDVEPGVADNLFLIALFGIIAAIPLLMGAWASPGDRRGELGLTMLISAGLGAASAAFALAIFLDPESKPYLPPMPKVDFAVAIGAVNLVVVTAIGWALYRWRKLARPAQG